MNLEKSIIIESKNLSSKNNEKVKPIENFLTSNTENIKIVNNVINTKSNLGFEELTNLLNKFDIPMTHDIKIENYSIKQLLDYRNGIAHGDNAFINLQIRDIQKIQNISKKIINLVEIIREKLKNKSSLILNF